MKVVRGEDTGVRTELSKEGQWLGEEMIDEVFVDDLPREVKAKA